MRARARTRARAMVRVRVGARVRVRVSSRWCLKALEPRELGAWLGLGLELGGQG